MKGCSPTRSPLGVEMVWSRRFAAALAASQIQYQPNWYDGSHPWNRSDTADFSSDLGGGLATAIAAASTPIAPPQRRRARTAVGPAAATAEAVMGVAAAVPAGSAGATPDTLLAFGDDGPILGSRFPRAIRR